MVDIAGLAKFLGSVQGGVIGFFDMVTAVGSFLLVLACFVVIQVFLFGQVWVLVKGSLAVKKFLQKHDVIPRVKEVFG